MVSAGSAWERGGLRLDHWTLEVIDGCDQSRPREEE